MLIPHSESVNRLTDKMQAGLQRHFYAFGMETPKALLSPQDRIRWAIEQAKKAGITPEELAHKAGLSRPGMLHWTKETTCVDAVGVGPLRRFAQAARVNLDWMMTGKGPPAATSAQNIETAELAEALALLANQEPAEYRVIARMIRAATEDHSDHLKPAGHSDH